MADSPLGFVGRIILGGVLIVGGALTGNAAVVRFGALIGAGGVLDALNGKPGARGVNLADRQNGATGSNNTNPGAPIPIVYGTAKMGVVLADLALDPGSVQDKDLYMPSVVCHGSRDGLGIGGVQEIFFHDRPATNAGGTPITPFTATNLFLTKIGGTSTENWADETIDGSDLRAVFPAEWDLNDRGRGLAGVLLKPVYDPDVYVNGVPVVTVKVKGNFVEDPRSEVSGVNITFADANPDTLTRASGSFVADGYAVNDRMAITGSASNNKIVTLATVTALTVTLVASDTLVAEGPVGGVTLKRWAHPDNGGDNPALCIRDYLLASIYGPGVAETSIDATSFNAMANYCDEQVTIPIGPGNQNRFRCNGWIDTDRLPSQVVDELLSSCRGNLIFEGGVFRLFIPRTVSPSTVTLNEDNIIGEWSIITPGVSEKPNVAKATFIDPDKNFQPDDVEWPNPGATNEYLTLDNSVLHRTEGDLPLTNNVYMAEQIAMTKLKEARLGVTCSVLCTEEALQLQIGDVVPVTHTTPGWNNKHFWVLGMGILQDTKVQVLLKEYDKYLEGVDLTFADNGASPDTITRASGSYIDEGWVIGDTPVVAGSASNDGTYTVNSLTATVLTLVASDTLVNEGPVSGVTLRASIYGLDAQSTAVAEPGSNLPNIFTVAAPAIALAATSVEAQVLGDGTYIPRIKVTITAPTNEPFVDFYEVQAQTEDDAAAGAGFDDWGPVDRNGSAFYVSPALDGVQYTVRTRSVSTAGIRSSWTSATVTPANPPGSTSTPFTDGFSAAQNTASPENGNVTITADNAVAYSNLEDANTRSTTYTIYYDIDATGMGGANLATVTLYKNDGPTSTTWTQVGTSNTYDNTDNLTDETIAFTGAMDVDWDLRVQLTYGTAPGGSTASLVLHGEDHGTQPGVQWNKIT